MKRVTSALAALLISSGMSTAYSAAPQQKVSPVKGTQVETGIPVIKQIMMSIRKENPGIYYCEEIGRKTRFYVVRASDELYGLRGSIDHEALDWKIKIDKTSRDISIDDMGVNLKMSSIGQAYDLSGYIVTPDGNSENVWVNVDFVSDKAYSLTMPGLDLLFYEDTVMGKIDLDRYDLKFMTAVTAMITAARDMKIQRPVWENVQKEIYSPSEHMK